MPEVEVFVGLTLNGDFDPEVVTERFGIEPTRAHARGSQMSERTRRVAAQAQWSIDSEAAVTADTIEPHLNWLLDLIEGRRVALSETVSAGATAYVDCYWASIGMSGGPWLTPESMRRLADLNLPLIISFYATSRD